MDGYRKVIVNTGLAVFMAFANYNMIIIALPAILSGLDFNPLSPYAFPYIVWLILGYMVVTAAFVGLFGRLGDVYGKYRVFSIGYLVFAVSSLLMALIPPLGTPAVTMLIVLRIVQGIGGGLLMANSSAIIADSVPRNRLGWALSMNQSLGLIGGVAGLILGGVLSVIDWRLLFLLPGAVGIVGFLLTRGYKNQTRTMKLDLPGGLLMALGLSLILLGSTLVMIPGVGEVTVLSLFASGAVALALLAYVETKTVQPLFDFRLFRLWDFSIAMLTNTLVSAVRQGTMILLIVLLQAVWLPLHGVPFDQTPLLAGLYMLPNSLGFAVSAPVAGRLSDRIGSRALTTAGLAISAISTFALYLLPYDFPITELFVITFFSGLGMGLFSAPNLADILASTPPQYRGAASGLRGSLQNTASAIAVTAYFLMLFSFLYSPLNTAVSSLDPGTTVNPAEVVFAALLGYPPIPGVNLTPSQFGEIIAQPFMVAFDEVVLVSTAVIAFSAVMSYFRRNARLSPAREAQKT